MNNLYRIEWLFQGTDRPPIRGWTKVSEDANVQRRNYMHIITCEVLRKLPLLYANGATIRLVGRPEISRVPKRFKNETKKAG